MTKPPADRPVALVLGLSVLAVALLLGAFGWLAGQAAPEAAPTAAEAPTPVVLPERVPSVSPPPRVQSPARERSAEALAFDEAARLNSEGVDALDGGDHDTAIARFREALDLVPDHRTFAHNLTESYVGRALERPTTEAALQVLDLEAALVTVTTDERRADIEGLLERARAISESEAEFVVESTLHFSYRFDGTRGELYAGLEPLKVALESTYHEFGDLFQRFPVEEGEPKIPVVLYRREGFDRVTGLGDWAGGAFDGTIRVPVDDLESAANVDRIRRVLRHEVAHAFVRLVGGEDVPAWLNEGVAERLEDPSRRAFDVRMARGRLAQGGEALFTLGELRGTLAAWQDQAKIRRAYDQALAFTDYVAEQYGEDLLYGLVAACESAGAGGAAARFREVILVDLETAAGDFADGLR